MIAAQEQFLIEIVLKSSTKREKENVEDMFHLLLCSRARGVDRTV
jgi:hypothetical protein